MKFRIITPGEDETQAIELETVGDLKAFIGDHEVIVSGFLSDEGPTITFLQGEV